MTEPAQPLYSVVVPAYNAQETLHDCLSALYRQSIPRREYEILVVDDGSSDGTAELAQQFQITCLRQTNQGPASARNAGFRAARGDIILFTDADCVPERTWLEEMLSPFANGDVTAVKGAYTTGQTRISARFAQAEFEDRYDLLEQYACIDMIDTYAAAFRKQDFLRFGGFDESFPKANNEDTDFSYRLSASGCRMVFNRLARVRHTHPDTLSAYLNVKFWRGYWRMMVYRRYPKKALADTYTPGVLKVQTLCMALSFALLALSPLAPRLLLFVPAAWLAVLLTSVPFAAKIGKKDPLLGLISPGIILLRGGALAAGSLLGLAAALAAKFRII